MLNLQFDAFLVDESDKKVSPEEDITILTYSYFEVPVYIWADKINLIESKGKTLSLPILDIAFFLDNLLNNLHYQKKVEYALHGYGAKIQFSLKDKAQVEVYSDVTDILAIFTYEEVMSEIKKFQFRVKMFLNCEIPQLKFHTELKNWLNA